jgi:hypothetical protein
MLLPPQPLPGILPNAGPPQVIHHHIFMEFYSDPSHDPCQENYAWIMEHFWIQQEPRNIICNVPRAGHW